MKLFQIILVLISLILITNCVGIPSQKIDSKLLKDKNILPKPVFLTPDAIYMTAGYGERWDLRQYLNFRFWELSPFTNKEAKLHESAVYTALNNVTDFEVVSWYSETRNAGGKVRPIFTYHSNLSTCRDYQVVLRIEKKIRSKTLTGCKNMYKLWSFNYWDWPGAEKYLN